MKRWFLIVLLMQGLATENCFAQSESKAFSDPTAIVLQLYRDFAWEAVMSLPEQKRLIGLMGQPRAILERYFDTRLTNLILRDRECVKRTKEICNLNFDPIWASQYPGASDMTITSGEGNTVNVEFRYPGDGHQISLIYQTTKVSGHWRISDIHYTDRSSLVSILESKEEWFAKAVAAVSRNKLTVLKPGCYGSTVDKENAKYLELTFREIHNDECGGDPMVEPRLFSLHIDKKSGRIWADVPPPGAKGTYDGDFKYELK